MVISRRLTTLTQAALSGSRNSHTRQCLHCHLLVCLGIAPLFITSAWPVVVPGANEGTENLDQSPSYSAQHCQLSSFTRLGGTSLSFPSPLHLPRTARIRFPGTMASGSCSWQCIHLLSFHSGPPHAAVQVVYCASRGLHDCHLLELCSASDVP